MAQWSEEELAGMSDAEREALLDEEEVDESVEPEAEGDDDEGIDDDADDRLAGDDEADDDDDEADDEDEAEGDDEGDEPVDDEDDAEKSGEEAEPTEDRQPDMPFNTEVPEGADQRLVQIEADIEELDRQFQDGEIDLGEFRSKERSLTDERQDIRSAIKMREAEERGRHQAELRNQINVFNELKAQAFKSNPIYQDDRGQELFQEAINIVAQTHPDEMDGNRFFSMVDRMARGNAMADGWGLEVLQNQQKNEERDEGKRRGRKKSARDRANVPPNIGDAPAAEIPETSNSEFAHLEKLSGMEIERALAKLSPDQVDRLLRSQ